VFTFLTTRAEEREKRQPARPPDQHRRRSRADHCRASVAGHGLSLNGQAAPDVRPSVAKRTDSTNPTRPAAMDPSPAGSMRSTTVCAATAWMPGDRETSSPYQRVTIIESEALRKGCCSAVC